MILVQAVADGRLSGGTTHVLQLIEAVRAELPVEVHLLTQANSAAASEGARLGAVVHGVDFFASRLDPRVGWRLRALVARLRPALIHAHGGRVALPLTSVAGAGRLIYSVHGYHFVGKPFGLRQLAILAERRCAARADLTVFVCRHDRDLAERAGILARTRAHRVILNGLDTHGLPRVEPGDGRTLGFLGRLSPEKNPLFALDVLERLQSQKYRLVVIGDGPLMPVIRAQAEARGLVDRIELTGSLARPDALARLAALDVLLLPSLWEALPLAPLEAMAIGVPVIASRVGGLPEVIEDGVTGFLIDGHDPAGYVAAVRRLRDEPGLRGRFVENARARIAATFDWSAVQRTYLDLYRDASSSNPKS